MLRMAAALAAVQPPLASAKLTATYHRNLRCRLSIRNGNPRSPLKARVLMAFANGNGRGEGGGEDLKKGEHRPALKLRWRDLLDPDPDNIPDVGLPGMLVWASVQVLRQIVFFLAMLFLNFNIENIDSFKFKYQEVAEHYKGKGISFLVGDLDASEGALQYFGLKAEQTPLIVIQDINGVKYVKVHLEPDQIATWLKQYKDGNVTLFRKSETIPEVNDEPVKIVVADNLKDVAFNSGKNVLLELYAPWCGHCKKLAPILDEVAVSFENDANVVMWLFHLKMMPMWSLQRWMALQMIFQMSLKGGVTQPSSFPQPATRSCSTTEIGQPKTSLILSRKTGTRTRTRTLQFNPTLERMNYNKEMVYKQSKKRTWVALWRILLFKFLVHVCPMDINKFSCNLFSVFHILLVVLHLIYLVNSNRYIT